MNTPGRGAALLVEFFTPAIEAVDLPALLPLLRAREAGLRPNGISKLWTSVREIEIPRYVEADARLSRPVFLFLLMALDGSPWPIGKQAEHASRRRLAR